MPSDLAPLYAARDLRGPSRRTVLRSLGAVIALPWLESLAGAAPIARALAEEGGATAAVGPTRVAFVFIPNGVDPTAWMPAAPAAEGALAALPPSLEPLAALRSRFTILSGLAHRNAQALGDGPGDHARSAACFLTGAHPVKTAGSDILAGVSIDQLLAERLGASTTLPSLELGCEPALQSGNCDSGYSCAYSANISWRTARQPNLKEIRPREVFERLFSVGPGEHDSTNPKARAERVAQRRSILDFARDDADRLRRRLGGNDRVRLDEYFESVRSVEKRIESVERALSAAQGLGGSEQGSMPAPAAGVPEDYREHVRLMNRLLVLAFRLDRTRVATFMMANEGSNRSFPFLGVPEGHHHLSHHGGDTAMVDKIRLINRFQSEMFADLLAALDAEREGEATVLDSSMVVFGSAIGDGNQHNHDNLPILLAGGGGGIQPGRHLHFSSGTPLCNLFASLARRAGAPLERFGDSNGELAGL